MNNHVGPYTAGALNFTERQLFAAGAAARREQMMAEARARRAAEEEAARARRVAEEEAAARQEAWLDSIDDLWERAFHIGIYDSDGEESDMDVEADPVPIHDLSVPQARLRWRYYPLISDQEFFELMGLFVIFGAPQ